MCAVVILHERLAQSLVAFDPAVVEPTDIAHPVAVDVRIQPRGEPDEPRSFGPFGLRFQPRGRIAAFGAPRADGIHGNRVVPRARLEAVITRGDRADRTHVHQVARDERVHAFFLEGRDFAAVPAIDDVDLRVAVHVAHEADAARAQNAALAVEHERRPEVDVAFHALAVEHATRKIHPALVGAEAVREILQRTLAAFVTHRAIQWMVDQEEFEDARARLNHIRSLRVHDHAVAADGRARRLQLRHLLDLDDAHTAGAVDTDARVITVIRNRNSALDGGL